MLTLSYADVYLGKKAMHYKHTKAITRRDIKESSVSDDKCKPWILTQLQ